DERSAVHELREAVRHRVDDILVLEAELLHLVGRHLRGAGETDERLAGPVRLVRDTDQPLAGAEENIDQRVGSVLQLARLHDGGIDVPRERLARLELTEHVLDVLADRFAVTARRNAQGLVDVEPTLAQPLSKLATEASV